MPKLEKVEPDVDARIGELIRLRRIELGLSQADLAALIGMSFQQVQKYERGTNRLASSILIRVANALNCSAGELLGEANSKHEKKWAQALAADRALSAVIERLLALKTTTARRRIVNMIAALLDEATDARPEKAPATNLPRKTAAPTKKSTAAQQKSKPAGTRLAAPSKPGKGRSSVSTTKALPKSTIRKRP